MPGATSVLVTCLALSWPALVWTWCLRPPPANPRKILINNTEYKFPLGFGVWSSPQPVADIIHILMTEELGIDVEKKGPYLGSELLLRALAGCPTDGRPCDDTVKAAGGFRDPPEIWAAAEVWATGNNERRLLEYCSSAGPVGYVSTPSLNAYSRVHEAAFQAGELTGYWRSLYRPQAKAFFSNVSVVDAAIRSLTVPMGLSFFFGCDATTCAQPGNVRPGAENGAPTPAAVWSELASNGVQVSGDGWFYAPACRNSTETCIPVILGARVWNFEEWCQVAVRENLPLAITFLGWFGEQLAVAGLFQQNLDVLFYWWQPDNTFLAYSPRMSFFSEEVLIIRQFQNTKKVIWRDLVMADEEAFEFLSQVSFSNADLDGMMVEFGTKSPAEIACDWLKANNNTWQSWLPDPTNCDRGFFYNEVAAECQACQPGTITDKLGRRQCTSCTPGKHAMSLAGSMCMDCPAGKFSSVDGASSCAFCPEGTFANVSALPACFPCWTGFTAQVASQNETDCVCPEGTYRTDTGGVQACTPCPPSMNCPMGSNERFLPRGPGETPAGPYPQVDPGFYTTFDEPFSLYKCGAETHCPGGAPESCAGTRFGRCCGQCPMGETPTADGCVPCDDGSMAMAWSFGVLALLAVPAGLYYGANSRVTIVTTCLAGTTISGGIMVTSFQVLATFQTLQFPWPSASKGIMSTVGLTLFNGDAVGANCVIGNEVTANYLTRVLFTFVVASVFFLIFGLTKALGKLRILPSSKAWDFKKTVNSIGAFLQVAFISLVGIVVTPMQCYEHPNGLTSIMAYPQILCWQDSEHMILVAFGMILLLLVIVPFLVANMIAGIRAPEASREYGGASTVIICFRFLLYKYRPDVWWWGNLLSIRQLLIAFVPTMAADDANLQMVMVASILVVYMTLTAVYWPWKCVELNLLDLTSVMLLLLISVTAGSFIPLSAVSETHQTMLLAYLCGVFTLNGIGILMALLSVLCSGRKRDFGCSTYPRKKDLATFANEWGALVAYHKGLSVQDVILWMRAMNNFDRYNLNTVISIAQSYTIAGQRKLISTEVPRRIVLDENSKPEPIEPFIEEPAQPPFQNRLLVV